jgi:hypothetical protein
MVANPSKTLSPAQRQLMASAALNPERRLTCPPEMALASFGRTVQALVSRGLVQAVRQKTKVLRLA